MSDESRSQGAILAHERRAFAELALAVVLPPDDDALSRVAPAVVRAAMDLAYPPPLGILVDLVHLLLVPGARIDHARERAVNGLPTDDPMLRRAVASVFDVLLSPLAMHPATNEIRDALARHEGAIAIEGAGALAAEIALRAPAANREPLRAAVIRKALGRSAREVAAKGTEALADPIVARDIAASYEAIAVAARRSPSVVGASDIVVAEGAPHLRNRAARVALRHVADAASEIGKHVPNAIARRRQRVGDFATRQNDESSYPMGGFASMSSSGSLENVVTSELAFATNGDISEDLFAVRWAIGELLYYTRDEAVARRRRVSVWIVLGADLATARVKDEDSRWQRLVLTLGAISVFVQRTMHLLRNEALTIRVATPPSGELGEEHALLRVVLASAIASKHVELVERTSSALDPFVEADSENGEALRVDVTADEDALPKDNRNLVLSVGKVPRVASVGDAHMAAGTSAIARWADMTRSLLLHLP